MHGLFASSEAMSHAQSWIEQDFPGIYVHNVEIGDGQTDSLIVNMNDQVDLFAQAVQNDARLSKGFNLIGHSQGGLVSRGYVERYNVPPVYNLITWASPHGGQYGIPAFDVPELDKLFSEFLESPDGRLYESVLSFAAYWKDPYNYTTYLNMSIFLADLNNERDIKNSTYKSNILSLNTMALEDSTADDIVVPYSSPWFESFALNQSEVVVPLKESAQYLEDWLGLRTLDAAGKLQLFETDCDHQDFPRDACKKWYDLYTKPLLNNFLP